MVVDSEIQMPTHARRVRTEVSGCKRQIITVGRMDIDTKQLVVGT
jgi:hypothetical protein